MEIKRNGSQPSDKGPGFGKTLLTRILHIILHKNSVEESLILPKVFCFGSICVYPLFLNF